MSVIGIDFGNVECVIAQAKRGGIDIILNENSNRKNPNMVCVQGKQRFIGEAAISLARMHFRNTATDLKRLIGRKFRHEEVQREISQLAYKCAELPNGDVGIVLNYNNEEVTFTCAQVIAMVLNKMQIIATKANEGVAPAFCVLSCPGYFTDRQRRALLNACDIAGLNCLRLLNEHTAVALAYGIYKSARNLFHESEPQHVMFIDIGHSNYTVSVVAFVQGKLQVKSAAYDRFLGGRDFDMALAEDAAKNFIEKCKIDPLKDPKSRMKLLSACEKSKKNLSPHGVTATFMNIECLAEEYDYSGQITLEHFEELVTPLLDRLEAPIQQALQDAGIEKSQLACVEIVGGGTRVASVKRRLAEILGLDKEAQNYGLSTTLNADESVARGCALQCAILSPLFKVKEFSIADRVHLPVRISWDDENTESTPMETGEDNEDGVLSSAESNSVVIFSRKDDFPKTKRITFRRDKTFSVEAKYDDSAKTLLPNGYDLHIGKFTVSGIPPLEAGEETPKIRVNLHHDMNGLIGISSSQLMQEIKEEKETATENPTQEQAQEQAQENTKEEQKTEEKPVEPKKKRFRKVELQIQSEAGGMSVSELNAATEYELAMAQQDRVIEETCNKRNELESYVYEMRNHMSDRFREFASEEERNKIETALTELEDWLYTDEGFDSSKSVYQSKLDELRKLTSAIEFRHSEHFERGTATSELQALVEDYKRMSNSNDEKYSHWTLEEREKLRDVCKDAETWLFDELAKQNELNLTQTPIVTSASIRAKTISLRSSALPILTKSKPIPKPEPAQEQTKEKEEEETKKEGTDKNEKMDLD